MSLKLFITSFLFTITGIYCQAQDTLRVFDVKGAPLLDSMYTVHIELPESPYTIEKAKKNIANDTLILIFQGGFTGFGKIDEKKLKRFQKKYNVKFEYLGCIRSWDTKNENIDGYNEITLEYLSKKYNRSVKKEFEEIKK